MKAIGGFGGRIPDYVIGDLLFFHDPAAAARPAWWRASSAFAVAVVTVGLFTMNHVIAPPNGLTWSDKHRNRSLEIALNRVLCGTNSRLSPSFSVARELETHPELGDVPLRDLTVKLAGSTVEYCRSVTQPFLNNENSLMLEMAAFLGAEPQLSLRQLGWRLQATRVAALVTFALVLLENGASLSFAAALLALGLGMLGYLGGTSYYSVYSFLPVLLVLTVALLALALQHGLRLGRVRLGVFSAVVGWLVAFAVNMRSSHLPVYVTLLVLSVLAAYRRARSSSQPSARRARVHWLTMGVLGTSLGYALFGLLFIRPLGRDGSGGRAYSYHPVAHALVLGLAAPENPLSRREGIVWEDTTGLALARRVNPQVQYLREGYETALFTYYWRLWQRHPREMVQLYRDKLRLSGETMVGKLSSSPLAFLVWPLSWLTDGAAVLSLYVIVLGLAIAAYLRLGFAFAVTLALLSAAGALLQLESALVFSTFDMTHHGSQLFCFLVLAMLVWQLLLEGLRIAIRSAVRRSHGERQ